MAKKLPETAASQWWDLYAASLAEWTPNTDQSGEPGWVLLNHLTMLPRPPAGHPVLAALDGARNRMTGRNAKMFKPTIDRICKLLAMGESQTAVKPPKAPREADF